MGVRENTAANYYNEQNIACNLPIDALQKMHRTIKLRVYMTLIKPFRFYICPIWVLTRTSEKLIDAFERWDLPKLLATILPGFVRHV